MSDALTVHFNYEKMLRMLQKPDFTTLNEQGPNKRQLITSANVAQQDPFNFIVSFYYFTQSYRLPEHCVLRKSKLIEISYRPKATQLCITRYMQGTTLTSMYFKSSSTKTNLPVKIFKLRARSVMQSHY